MDLVDVHAHLTHADIKSRLDEVLKNARDAGVKYIITSGVNKPTNREVLELARRYEMIKASFGLYPIDLLGVSSEETGLERQTESIDMEEEFKFIEKNTDDIIAIGEAGMDFHWDKERHEEQKKNFERIVSLTEKIRKPIVIHSRKAEKECLDILESSDIKKVDLHCFSGNKKLIRRAADLGYCFSIPPNIIRLEHFQMIADMVDISQLLTETDAPWLSPYPDKRNEPAFVRVTVEEIAKIKKIPPEDAAAEIYKNFERVFV